ncbi:MAG: sigma-70 family RNA polymerase sigma factor [Tessaracoccus sp.]
MTASTPATAAWHAERDRLLGIAYRMLGDFGHAEDVVSEVAIEAVRAERTAAGAVRSWPAWLTTVCVRRSIDSARRQAAAREEYPGPWLPEPVATQRLPEDAVANRELLSVVLLHLAEQLAPEARAALILHRAFDMSSVEIGEILDKSPAAVRQMISRAERRLQIDPDAASIPQANHAAVEKLVTAIEAGDIDTVLAMLDRDAILWSDGGGKVRSARNPLFGAENIVRFLVGILASAARDFPDQPARFEVIDINGGPAIRFHLPGRRDVVSIEFASHGLIRGVRQVANPEKLTRIEN